LSKFLRAWWFHPNDFDLYIVTDDFGALGTASGVIAGADELYIGNTVLDVCIIAIFDEFDL